MIGYGIITYHDLMEDGLWGYGTPARLFFFFGGGSATHKLLAAIAGEIRTYEH